MPDLIDEFLSLGSTPDWISPLSGIIQDFTNGPHFRFYVDRNTEWSVNAIKGLLADYGIHVWGDLIAKDMIIFTVRQNQAQWVYYLLHKAGIPVLNVPEGKTGRPKPTSKKPTAKSEWRSFFEWLLNK